MSYGSRIAGCTCSSVMDRGPPASMCRPCTGTPAARWRMGPSRRRPWPTPPGWGRRPRPSGGNFNFRLGDLHRVPGLVLAALLTRRLIDADRELAQGGPCVCRYTGAAGTQPSRIQYERLVA